MSIQEEINRLLWDRRLVTLPSDLEVPDGIDYVVLKDLTLDDRNHYLFMRDLMEEKARKEKVPTEGELMDSARIAGYWGKEEDEIEEKADEHIAYLEGEFEAKKKFKSRQNIIELQIKDAKAKKAWVENKKNQLKQKSAEYLAHETACFHLIARVALKPDGTKLIPNEQQLLFLKQEYPVLLYFLIQEMMSEGALDIVDIRSIARSTEWRLVWVLSRENLPALFNRPVGDLNINHRMLIYWSRVYDSAIESTEPPDNETINDDELFDAWLADRDIERRERNNERGHRSSTADHQEQGQILDGEYIEKCTCGARAKNAGKGLGERIPHEQGCLYGTWHEFTPEEREAKARRIYGKNAKNIRQTLDRQQEVVLRRGVLEEQDLRDKKSRQLMGMPTKVTPVRR